ncbi:MAG: hypothetical protein ACLGGX_11955 [Bdellovibrionia bacterium]
MEKSSSEAENGLTFILIKRSSSADSSASAAQILNFFAKWSIEPKILTGTYNELSSLLASTSNHIVAILPAELSTPLGDVLKLYQTLLASPDIQVVFGDRFKKKNNPYFQSKSRRVKFETFFTPLVSKSLRGLFADPLCDTVVLKAQLFATLPEAEKKRIDQFKWTPHLMSLSVKHNWRSADVGILDHGNDYEKVSTWKLLTELIRNVGVKY